MILGIDPGLHGALVFLSHDAKTIDGLPMPTIGNRLDLWSLNATLKDAKEKGCSAAYVEFVSSRPKQGVRSVFTFGEGFGALQGLLVGAGIRFTLVTPQKWTKLLHEGTPSDLGPKEKSRLAVQRLFPGLDLRKSSRSRVPHSGLIDALLIAEYGRRHASQLP